jgi:hypothetical protein
MTRLEAAGKPATAVLTGYVVVTADDLGAASALPQDCPAAERRRMTPSKDLFSGCLTTCVP